MTSFSAASAGIGKGLSLAGHIRTGLPGEGLEWAKHAGGGGAGAGWDRNVVYGQPAGAENR